MSNTIERRWFDQPYGTCRADAKLELIERRLPEPDVDRHQLFAAIATADPAEQQAIIALLDGALAMPVVDWESDWDAPERFEATMAQLREHLVDKAYGFSDTVLDDHQFGDWDWIDDTIDQLAGFRGSIVAELRRHGTATGYTTPVRTDHGVVELPEFNDADTNPVLTSDARPHGMAAIIDEIEGYRGVGSPRRVVDRTAAKHLVTASRLHAEAQLTAEIGDDVASLPVEQPLDADCVGWTRLQGGRVEPAPVSVWRIPADPAQDPERRREIGRIRFERVRRDLAAAAVRRPQRGPGRACAQYVQRDRRTGRTLLAAQRIAFDWPVWRGPSGHVPKARRNGMAPGLSAETHLLIDAMARRIAVRAGVRPQAKPLPVTSGVRPDRGRVLGDIAQAGRHYAIGAHPTARRVADELRDRYRRLR